MEKKYYNEIKELIETKEVNSRVRAMQDNSDTLNTYWNIGRLIVEAQGGEKRAKYGNELIKKWSEEFTQKYGKGYDFTNLSRFRKFYLTFPIIAPAGQQLSWTHIKTILPIKNENDTLSNRNETNLKCNYALIIPLNKGFVKYTLHSRLYVLIFKIYI